MLQLRKPEQLIEQDEEKVQIFLKLAQRSLVASTDIEELQERKPHTKAE